MYGIVVNCATEHVSVRSGDDLDLLVNSFFICLPSVKYGYFAPGNPGNVVIFALFELGSIRGIPKKKIQNILSVN